MKGFKLSQRKSLFVCRRITETLMEQQVYRICTAFIRKSFSFLLCSSKTCYKLHWSLELMGLQGSCWTSFVKKLNLCAIIEVGWVALQMS